MPKVPVTALAIAVLLAFSSGAGAATVTYEVRFDASWNPPAGSPPNPHFSPLIGGTHDSSITFFEVGGSASAGIEAMAEQGNAGPLQAEVQAAIGAGSAFSVISGPGINPSPGSATASFELSDTHPLVTLTSMIAPSPDWFVGVSNLALFDAGGFLNEIVVQLFPYDAGTDSGTDFTSQDMDSNELITLLTGPPFEGTPPLGTFTFRLVPEPSTALLLSTALLVLGGVRRVRA